MEELFSVFFALVMVALLVVIPIALVVQEVLFRRRPVGRRWRSLIQSLRQSRGKLEAFYHRYEQTHRRVGRAAANYEREYLRRINRRRPIRELTRHVSVSMSWKALEDVGISTIDDFLGFRRNFEAIHGIGEARARALVGARRKVIGELQEYSLPMPTPHRPGTVEYELIEAGLEFYDLHLRAMDDADAAERALQEVDDRRPGALSVRWRYWRGDDQEREALDAQLADIVERVEEIENEEVASLEHVQEQAGVAGGDLDAIGERYQQNAGRLKDIFDSGMQRNIRGTLRPYGVDAMRAAEGFDDEDDFCERGLAPLVEEMGFDYEREYHLKRRIGSRSRNMYVDFLVLDAQTGQKVAILEAKRSIRSDADRDAAANQGLSYALFEGLTPVMVSAPEGLWVYERSGQDLQFHRKYDVEEAYERADELRRLVESLGEE